MTQIGESAVGRTTGTTSGTTTTGGASATSADEAKDFKVVVIIDNPPAGLRQGLIRDGEDHHRDAQRTCHVTVPIQAVTVRMRRELEEKNGAAKPRRGEAM